MKLTQHEAVPSQAGSGRSAIHAVQSRFPPSPSLTTARRDLGGVPNGQDAGDRGYECSDSECQRAMQRHVVPERLHPGRIVADALERDPERRSRQVADAEIQKDRGDERDVVKGNRVEDRVADYVRAGHASDSPVPAKLPTLAEQT